KPWRQKGTGRARQGSIRAVQWKGGGVAFAPKPRDYSFRMPAKARQAAMRSALTDALSSGKLVALESFELKEIKTKTAAAFFQRFAGEKKVILVVDKLTDTERKSLRNLDKAQYCGVSQLAPYNILWAEKIIITKAALSKIEE